MSEQLTWHVGNRNPSITENLVDANDAAVNLTGKTVKFKAREVGSSTLLVDQAAIVVGAEANGNVRYDWSADDIDPAFNAGAGGALSKARDLLVWWEVTTTSGGRKQDYMEALIGVDAHAPGANAYAELEEFKSAVNLTGMAHADDRARRALVSASRWVDDRTHRRFWLDADVNQLRYYTPSRSGRVEIDDLVTLTWLKTDPTGDGSFGDVWTLNEDFTLEPDNAATEGRPWETLCRHPNGDYQFPLGYPRSIEVKGRFGWASVPVNVKDATLLVAARIFKRPEAPYGVVTFGVEGPAVRELGLERDPELNILLEPYTRSQVLA